jgi:hypothetical protein
MVAGVNWIHLVQDCGPVVSCCEHSNESSFSIKSYVFIDYISDCQLLKESVAYN